MILKGGGLIYSESLQLATILYGVIESRTETQIFRSLWNLFFKITFIILFGLERLDLNQGKTFVVRCERYKDTETTEFV